MKRIILAAALLLAPVAYQGCSTAPSARVVEATTLGVVGQTAKAAIDTASQLLKDGKITVAQYQTVASFYDTKFQPAYNVALTAVQSNLSSIASPDLVTLAAQVGALVAQLTNPVVK